jgi:hypothetical protein
MATKNLFTFDGTNEIFKLGGNAGSKSWTLGGDAGYVYSGTQSGKLLVQAASGDQNAQLLVQTPYDQINNRARLFCRFILDHADDEFDYISWLLQYHNGTEQLSARFHLESAYGVTDEVQLYVEPATYEDISATIPWAGLRGNKLWNEIEIVVDFANLTYDFARMNSVYSYAPTATEIDQVTTGGTKGIALNTYLQCTTTQRLMYIDEITIDLMD